jgi:hypothetical protein
MKRKSKEDIPLYAKHRPDFICFFEEDYRKLTRVVGIIIVLLIFIL